ncbi:MAG: Hsp20/alpha crystallin family protein [Myxococcaceae bacterium]
MAAKAGDSSRGFLEGITNLVEKLAELAEKGEQLQRSGEFTKDDDPEKKLKGVFGLNVRIGGAAPGQRSSIPRVQPFGNIRRDQQTGKAVVQPIREPLVDVFEEGPDVLVVAELPGMDTADLKLDLAGDVLTLHAERGQLKYHKEVLLPKRFSREQMHTSCRNGVLEIRLTAGEEPSP